MLKALPVSSGQREPFVKTGFVLCPNATHLNEAGGAIQAGKNKTTTDQTMTLLWHLQVYVVEGI